MSAMTTSPTPGSLVRYLILLLEYFALPVHMQHKQQPQGSVWFWVKQGEMIFMLENKFTAILGFLMIAITVILIIAHAVADKNVL